MKTKYRLKNPNHPKRAAAIRIVAEVIEPLLKRGLNADKWQAAEDAIVVILKRL